MSVLDRASLEQSPLADLHAIASELSIDGYRRLRKPELIDAILERQAGGEGRAGEADDEPDEHEQPAARRRRGRRGGRGRGAGKDDTEEAAPEPEADDDDSHPEDDESHPENAESHPENAEKAEAETEHPGDEVVEGVVELLPGGSGFLRVDPPEPSDGDVYISAAQVKRCELISGDRVAGPRRAPRRSERFASLLRVDTINGRPAAELADSARFNDLPAAFPSERFALAGDDFVLTAIETVAPIGRGSRVTIAGGSQSGKTEALRRLAAKLSGDEALAVSLALTGVRPEEIGEWRRGPLPPSVALGLGASPEAQGQALEGLVEQARRLASRGAHAVVLIDTLAALPAAQARRALGAARNIVDGGSVTVIATAPEPLGGETTVIALDTALARAGRFPAVDLDASWTMRPELLVGETRAEAIASLRSGGLG